MEQQGLLEGYHRVGDRHGRHQNGVEEGRHPDVARLLIQVARDDRGDRERRHHRDQHNAGERGAGLRGDAPGEEGDVLAGKPEDGAARVEGDGQQIALDALQTLGVGVDRDARCGDDVEQQEGGQVARKVGR